VQQPSASILLHPLPLSSSYMPASNPARRPHALSLAAFFLASCAALVAAQDAACHLSHDGVSYDLSPLTGSHFVHRERATPPTTMSDVIDFSICGELSPKDGVAAADQVRPALQCARAGAEC
jgi:hypothetical protein